MADNSARTPGTGENVRSKDRTTAKTQIVALDLNPAGSESLMAGAMPVTDNGGSLTVDGTVGISGTVPVSGTFYQATQPVSAGSLPLPTGAATDTQLTTSVGAQADAEATGNGSAIAILKRIRTLLAGTLTTNATVSNFPATQVVSGTVTANAGTGTMSVTGTGTAGTPAAGVQTVQGVSGGTPQPVTATAMTDGTQKSRITSGTVDAGVEPFGALQVNNGFQTLFYDEWLTNPIDTTDRWTVTGTTPTVGSGSMVMSATLSSYNAIRTKDTIRPNVGFTLVRNGIQIEAGTGTGAGRFWGLGTTATTPAAAVLAQDGVGFEIDQATGALYAVTYAAGARTIIATLPASGTPTGTGANASATVPNFRDGTLHAYGMYFRVTQAYWIIDGITVASQSFPNVQVAALPALIVRQNAASLGGTTPVFSNIAHLTADTSRQSAAVSDPVIGTRQARVTSGGALSISELTPQTTGTAAGNIFRARVNPSSITASTALVAAPAAGLSLYLTDINVSNAGATNNTVSLLDGATGIWDVHATASGGGAAMNFRTPIKLTAATALNYTTSAASSTFITVTGYIAA